MADDRDVEITSKGVVLKGAYADIRPAVLQAVNLAETVLGCLDTIVGLPADFLKYHLAPFRERYRTRLEAIPPERRNVPPLRIGCAILKEVAYAAEEPAIQEMFANLLGTSSDTATQAIAHPGFADVITQLLPLDAKILSALIESGGATHLMVIAHYFAPDDDPDQNILFRTSLDNLVRLGLLEWDFKGVRWTDAVGLKPRVRRPRLSSSSHDVVRSVSALRDSISDTNSSFMEFADNVTEVLTGLGVRTSLKGTEFGRQFVAACLKDADESANQEAERADNSDC